MARGGDDDDTCVYHITHRRFKNENLLIMSIVQILCAVAAVTLATVSLTQRPHFVWELLCGYVAGSLMLLSGSIGVFTSRRRTMCTVITLLVLCILTAVASTSLAVANSIGLAQDTLQLYRRPIQHHIVVGLSLVVAVLDLGVTVFCSVVCSRQVCCLNDQLRIRLSDRGLVLHDRVSHTLDLSQLHLYMGHRQRGSLSGTLELGRTPPPQYRSLDLSETPPPDYSTVDPSNRPHTLETSHESDEFIHHS